MVDTITLYVFVLMILVYWYSTRNMSKFLGGPQAPLFSAPPSTVGVSKELYNPQSATVNGFLSGPQDPLFSAPIGPVGGSRDVYLTPTPVSAQF